MQNFTVNDCRPTHTFRRWQESLFGIILRIKIVFDFVQNLIKKLDFGMRCLYGNVVSLLWRCKFQRFDAERIQRCSSWPLGLRNHCCGAISVDTNFTLWSFFTSYISRKPAQNLFTRDSSDWLMTNIKHHLRWDQYVISYKDKIVSKLYCFWGTQRIQIANN